MTTNANSADVPAFIGFVDSTYHALRLINAARQGLIPRITRRLNDSERRTMIKSGAVFVFSVEESGIKRWTDGLLWSPSRIVGNFLVYREINERSSSRVGNKRAYHSPEAPSRGIGGQSDLGAGHKTSTSTTDQGTFKPNGLIKKTITVTVEGSDLHLISYYTSEDIRLGRLRKPDSRADIATLPMPPHIFRLTNFRTPPKVEIGPDGKARLVSDGDNNESVECKVEEQTYNVGHSPPWSPSQSSPVENSYPPSNSLYHPSSEYPSRHGATDRWGTNIDSLRLPGPVTMGWALPNPIQDPRRESSASSDSSSWSPLNSSSNRQWDSNGYESNNSSSAGGLFLDRPRMRSGSAFPGIVSPRGGGDDHGRSYSTYASGGTNLGRSHNHYSSSSHAATPRMSSSWMSNSSRDSTRTPIPHSASSSSFDSSPPPPPPPSHFSPHGYHPHAASHNYGSSWSPADSVSTLDLPLPSQSPFSPSLHSYDQYGSGSGTLPSPEEYTTKVEEL
ncbi:hypothetical protein EYR36_001652 [Pleurotus pulmonarius]|nr:hypothetical protein EYR36_008405 [Pleurotus pulmonarius]KAF4579832.1 hypothetical protein EYR36_001652 [Pleurotus pulmonarius]